MSVSADVGEEEEEDLEEEDDYDGEEDYDDDDEFIVSGKMIGGMGGGGAGAGGGGKGGGGGGGKSTIAKGGKGGRGGGKGVASAGASASTPQKTPTGPGRGRGRGRGRGGTSTTTSSRPPSSSMSVRELEKASKVGVLIEEILDDLENTLDEGGDSICSYFMDIPNLEDFKNAYEYRKYQKIIKHPTAISVMREKAKSNQYFTMKPFIAEFTQMITNAKQYNGEDSYVYEAAQSLYDQFLDALARFDGQIQKMPV